MKRILSCLLLTVCCTLFGSSLLIYASAPSGGSGAEIPWPKGPEIYGESAIVMDANSGTVLYEKNIHDQHYPASTTKILTALLAIENTTMDEKVTFSYDAVHKTEGSSIWRDVDEVLTMEQCLYALLLNSANECAYAIAEHTGGTYENFVKMMNDRAAALGCKDTHFNNPHGLTDEQHYTSCYDMALIGREALKNETFREITSTKRYQIPPTNKHPDEITYLKNHQKMLFEGEEYYYEACIGGKTGYTEAAGNTLVTFAEKEGMTLICVVMREKPREQYEDSKALLEFGFQNFRAYNIAKELESIEDAPDTESRFLSGGAFAGIDGTSGIVLPLGVDFAQAEMEVVDGTADKDTAAALKFTYNGHEVGQAAIQKTKAKVEKYPFDKKTESAGTEKKKVHIKVSTILLIIAGILALGAAGFGLYKFKDNFYLLRHKFKSYRKQHGGDKMFVTKQRSAQDVLRRKRRKRRR